MREIFKKYFLSFWIPSTVFLLGLVVIIKILPTPNLFYIDRNKYILWHALVNNGGRVFLCFSYVGILFAACQQFSKKILWKSLVNLFVFILISIIFLIWGVFWGQPFSFPSVIEYHQVSAMHLQNCASKIELYKEQKGFYPKELSSDCMQMEYFGEIPFRYEASRDGKSYKLRYGGYDAKLDTVDDIILPIDRN